MICIYHNKDLDGWASGAIMKAKFPNAKMVGYDYGQPYDINTAQKNEPVIMADVSMPMDIMLKIALRAKGDFTWIDHHITAIRDYEKSIGDGAGFLHAVSNSKISACEATWKHFFPDKAMPLAIHYLGEFDTFRNHDKTRWETQILPFQFGMRAICNSVETFPGSLLWSGPEVESIIKEITASGQSMLKYQAVLNESLCERASFECKFDGLSAICLNVAMGNLDTFKSVYDESKHDICIPFYFNGKQWSVSLYSSKPDIDCSAMAKSRNGGGHKGAAGFLVNDICPVFGGKML